MKQTAVDYLFEKLWQMPKDKLVWQHYLKNAKEREKEQIIDAYVSGKWDANFSHLAFEEYYKEVYESE